MAHALYPHSQAFVDQTIAAAQTVWSAAQIKKYTPFLRAYFLSAHDEQLETRAPTDLFGAAAAHLQFAETRAPQTALIRMYNPEYDIHGWQSTHTVIEIVNDDMPFLVDSMAMALHRHGMALHLLVHPVLSVERSAAGVLQSASLADATSTVRESFIHLEIDRQTDPEKLRDLHAELTRILVDIRTAVAHEAQIRTQLHVAAQSLAHAPQSAGEDAEHQAFLQWLAQDHFLFLGYANVQSVNDKLTVETRLGVLHDENHPDYSACFTGFPQTQSALAQIPDALTLVKSDARSTIHRSGHLDFIGVKQYGKNGAVIGEHRFVGLYTAVVYQASPTTIPIVRKKINSVIDACGYIENSHRAKSLRNVLETYPRDELFEISVEPLLAFARGIISVQERQRVRVFLRADVFGRYVSALVYLPRDNFNTDVRIKMNSVITQAVNGEGSEFNVLLSEHNLARIHYIIRTAVGAQFNFDAVQIEERIAHAVRGWHDELHQALIEQYGEERGNAWFNTYGLIFPAAYREDFLPRTAVSDIEKIACVTEGWVPRDLSMKLYASLQNDGSQQHFKLFRLNQPIGLSTALPMLENLGLSVLDEHPYRLEFGDGRTVFISDFGLTIADDTAQQALRDDANRREGVSNAI